MRVSFKWQQAQIFYYHLGSENEKKTDKDNIDILRFRDQIFRDKTGVKMKEEELQNKVPRFFPKHQTEIPEVYLAEICTIYAYIYIEICLYSAISMLRKDRLDQFIKYGIYWKSLLINISIFYQCNKKTIKYLMLTLRNCNSLKCLLNHQILNYVQ